MVLLKKILLTGGGTAGHVTPNLALIPPLREAGFEIHYAGRAEGIERALAEPLADAYHAVSSGKLRRYFNLKNFSDAFRVLKGCSDAFSLMRKIKPDIVFSKGGFVTVPVVAAARLCGVPAVLHESDITPGLANKLALPFARRVCVNFPETLKFLPKGKTVLTGTPIRGELLRGDRAEALKLCRFNDDGKPTVLVTGGSLGAGVLNTCLRGALEKLCGRYKVIHLCGKENRAEISRPGYAQFEYAEGELAHLFALADIAVSRAGANTLSELLALRKPSLLIPLTREASRGDQLLNAESFARQGFSMVLPEEALNAETLAAQVDRLYAGRAQFTSRMAAARGTGDGTRNVMRVIQACASNTPLF